jgi:GTP 3',8-cyclase
MKDQYGRTIDYLRISVTDKCNLRCVYCMPPEGVRMLDHDDLLSFEEITELAKVAVSWGVRKVRLTGGEPLLRRGIENLVSLLSGIPGIADLSMTTNGTLLAAKAEKLAASGLHRINISLDTINPEKYAEITRGGDVSKVFSGIEAALMAGLTPVKINCVITESSSEPDAREVAEFARLNDLEIRFIHRMDTEAGKFSIVEGGTGGDCPNCNRVRLSCDGLLRPCLLSDLVFNIREIGPELALESALLQKPASGGPCTHNWMRGIGG